MMILDDKFMLSEEANVYFAPFKIFYTEKDLYKYFLNYDEYIRKDDVSFHDDNILQGSMLTNKEPYVDNKGFYGIPYEIDFDTIFYKSSDDQINNYTYQNMKANDDLLLLSSFTPEPPLLEDRFNVTSYPSVVDDGILSIGLGNNDEMLNLFSEYIHLKYNVKSIPKGDQKSDFFSFLLNEKTSNEFYNSFKEFLIKYTGSNLNKTLTTSVQDSYNSFINNEKKFLKGKASNYVSLKNTYSNIIIRSLPNDISVINRKYLVINSDSKKDKNMLVQLALQLTSQEIQLYRAKEFGNLPTFDFKRKTPDDYTTLYCNSYPELCKLIRESNPIDITKLFQRGDNSASVMEVRLIMPSTLKTGISSNNYTIFNNTFINILNLESHSLTKFYKNNPIFLVQDILTLSIILILIIVVIMVHIHRKHPYLKAISPFLSNLTVIGMILNISVSKTMFFVNTELLCQLIYVIRNFTLNLTNFPMFAIIFRIYYIYTNISKVNFGKKLNDRRLLIIITIAIIFFLILTSVIIFSDPFYVTTFGSFFPSRNKNCYSKNQTGYFNFIIIYVILTFILMLIMTVRTIKVSRQFGEVKYILFIVLLLFSSIIYEFIYMSLMAILRSDTFYLIAHIVYMLCCLCCVYLLVGYRLIYVLKHPIKNGTYKGNDINNDYFNTTINIVDFIPLKKNRIGNFPFFKQSKGHDSNGTFSIVKDEDNINDPILSNPNNYFFNQALKLLDEESKQNGMEQMNQSSQDNQDKQNYQRQY
ncbi:hypothetical protein H8356DRAFT_1736775 [Neocallimastix lanati (nom. inval.)]|nr:hypothetical protein H8356DRAFT_1736775 [Neocallimastix sp. JGI-2020a]